MSFEAQKITGYASGISALPDKVEGRAAWLKAQFDARTDNEVKTQHNALCDALGAPDAAAGTGARTPAGIAASPAGVSGTDASSAGEAGSDASGTGASGTGTSGTDVPGAPTSVQAVLQGLADHTNAHTARRDNPHGVTAAQLGAYPAAEAFAAEAAAQLGAQAPAGITANPAPADGKPASVQAVLQGLADHAGAHAARRDNPHGVTAGQLDVYTRAQTDSAIAARVAQIGAGDMASTVYDPEGLCLPLLPKTGDGTHVTAVFTLAQQDEDICSGESLGVLFGKLARRLAAMAGILEGKADASVVEDALSGKAASSHTHTKSEVGLGNVDNTADSAKSVSYAASAGYATSAGSAVDQTARNTANAAMPKSGGNFTGNIAAYSTNRSGANLRNCEVKTSASGAVSTERLLFLRK